jgi:predicted metal-dependent hydrolase
MKQIIINGITIELEKKKIKNMYLRILPPDGKVHISAPMKMEEETIRNFVTAKMEWIISQQTRMHQRHIQADIEYVSGDEISVWGEKYYLAVKENCSHNTIKMNGWDIILSVKKDSTASQRKKIIDDWYRKMLMEELPRLIVKWENIIGVKSSGFHIRDMKTRWGTCNIRTGDICFNLQLAKKPIWCVEYVVVHELVHLLERSHNYIFKSYMDQFLPNWRMIKKELNGNIS